MPDPALAGALLDPPAAAGRHGILDRIPLLRIARALSGPLILFGLWYLTQRFGLLNPRLVPSPITTVASTWTALVHGTMLQDLSATVLRVVYAFALAAVLGVPFGLVIGANENVYRGGEFLIDFFRSTPSTALFPLFMLLFGIDDFSKISLAAFSAWLTIVFNVAYGVMNARKTRMLAARSMGASRWRVFTDVIFFETLPQTFVGLRSGISLALVVIIVSEMFIGSMDGLGNRIINAQTSYDLKDMYGSLLLTGMLGYGLNLIFLTAEKVFIHWSGR
jgi:NitT/TauT family transport system permease protein